MPKPGRFIIALGTDMTPAKPNILGALAWTFRG